MSVKSACWKSAKTCRTSDPLKPSREGSLCSDSTVFTFPLWPPKVYKMVAKSSQNGGPMLSKTSLERISKKGSKHVRFLIVFESQKGDQHGVSIVKNGGLRRALGLKGSLRGSGQPLGLKFGRIWSSFDIS